MATSVSTARGACSQLHIHRWAIANGITRMDLLRGSESYKEKWTSLRTMNRRVLIRPRGARSRRRPASSVRLAHIAARRASAGAGAAPVADLGVGLGR